MLTITIFLVVSFLFTFSLLISLFFVSVAQAQLKIGGSKQMSINQSQTLTATGGIGALNWTLNGGDGAITMEPIPLPVAIRIAIITQQFV